MELVSCQPPDDFLLPGVLSFNALMGLSCYMLTVYSDFQSCGFNALMGLSCYLGEAYKNCAANMFQCPHGLELLRLVYIRNKRQKDVSMPSWA